LIFTKSKFIEERDGKLYSRVSGLRWFTNLYVRKYEEDIILWKNYSPEEHPKYDNYDAIEVNKTANIPKDYDGIMGVPISFLYKWNPKQFEIIGYVQGNLFRELTEK